MIPTDFADWAWDRTLNRECSVIRLVSAVDPVAFGLEPARWRDIVRETARAWDRSGVVSFVVSFMPGSNAVPDEIEGTIVVKVHASPSNDWHGFTNPYESWRTGTERAALVWIDPDAFHVGIGTDDHLRYVLAHEIGHVLGLAHRASDSVMAGGAEIPTPTDLDYVRARFGGVV